MSDTLVPEDSACMSDKNALDLALKNECLKRDDPAQMAQSTEMDTQHEDETCIILNHVLDVISDLLVTTQTFFKHYKYFFKRCTFPDLQGVTAMVF